MIKKAIPLLLAALMSCASCTDSVSDEYSHERAYLRFCPVTGVPVLNTAVTSLGNFCTIRLGTHSFLFKSSDGRTDDYPYTAETTNYHKPECVAGFVVGKSSLPDLKMQYPLVAYDLVCPNCYEQSLIIRSLTLSGEELTCTRCQRVYDLTNRGCIKQGEPGASLKRYRTAIYNANESGGLLLIMN